ncbi:BMP family lipoprotein [Pseudalkalibacillus berkeleyi]|uniref:BMP family ABC transporter substrate-binding protein n=1 Tax=Pseudalkalibacillus berkeleyi TaxID=1069813 RepID=A0ABS9H290_9BACL|nr:BMP family ABC transporter substrate-binding protein [Pseudalkalibacillus berkeleyi]MCF6139063.1 BMP family ABC transporter substrate-binding protein [Pseudalkalibacillus berkeleyi]
MNNRYIILLGCILLVLSACSSKADNKNSKSDKSVGLVVTENGLGDESFSDSALLGVEKARDEEGVLFDYREPLEGDHEKQMEELIQNDHDLIIGLSFRVQEAMEKLAEKYPDQQFVLIDSVSDYDNITSITFKEDEGSYLVGVIAGMRTTTNTVGFIGGEKISVVEKFEKGFTDGVKSVNPDAEVLVEYTNTFGDDEKGAETARKQIENGADFVFPAAGFTGIGALKEAQKQGIYAFGVDSDQYYIAEEAIVTSMLKRVDNAIYEMAKQLKDGKKFTGEHKVLGLDQGGVGLAPIRLIELTNEEQAILEQAQGKGN